MIKPLCPFHFKNVLPRSRPFVWNLFPLLYVAQRLVPPPLSSPFLNDRNKGKKRYRRGNVSYLTPEKREGGHLHSTRYACIRIHSPFSSPFPGFSTTISIVLLPPPSIFLLLFFSYLFRLPPWIRQCTNPSTFKPSKNRYESFSLSGSPRRHRYITFFCFLFSFLKNKEIIFPNLVLAILSLAVIMAPVKTQTSKHA